MGREVARLQDRRATPLLLHVNLEAGHGGKSGRYEHLHEIAREYAFVIGLMLERAWGRMQGPG